MKTDMQENYNSNKEDHKEILGQGADLTVSPIVEQDFAYNQELYADLVHNQLVGVYRIRIVNYVDKNKIWDHLIHEFMSERFCEIVGLTESDLSKISKDLIYDLIYQDDKTEFEKLNKLCYKTLQTFHWEGRILVHQKIKWVRFDSNPRRLEDGSVRWTGVLADITRQKNMEELVRANSNRIMLLSDCLTTLKADYDVNINRLTEMCGELLDATSVAYSRYEEDVMNIVGHWHLPEGTPMRNLQRGNICYDLIQSGQEGLIFLANPPASQHSFIGNPAMSNTNFSFCGQVVRYDGKAMGALCIIHRYDYHISEEDRRIVAIVASAIGNEEGRRLRILKLKSNELKLRELVATKDKFFSIIAHDLRGPIIGIIQLLQLLRDDSEQLGNKSMVELIELIQSSAIQTNRLLDNLLTWSRIQRGNMQFKPVPIVLSSVVTEVIELFKEVAAHKSIKVVNSISNDLTVKADAEMLKSILRNLISNALKYTGVNGEVKIEASVDEKFFVISVTDNGIGIGSDNIAKLFNVGISFSTRGTDKEKGTGLGLILCKEFVEMHGGELRVESKLGDGSKFLFSLPKNMTEHKKVQ